MVKLMKLMYCKPICKIVFLLYIMHTLPDPTLPRKQVLSLYDVRPVNFPAAIERQGLIFL